MKKHGTKLDGGRYPVPLHFTKDQYDFLHRMREKGYTISGFVRSLIEQAMKKEKR